LQTSGNLKQMIKFVFSVYATQPLMFLMFLIHTVHSDILQSSWLQLYGEFRWIHFVTAYVGHFFQIVWRFVCCCN